MITKYCILRAKKFTYNIHAESLFPLGVIEQTSVVDDNVQAAESGSSLFKGICKKQTRKLSKSLKSKSLNSTVRFLFHENKSVFVINLRRVIEN